MANLGTLHVLASHSKTPTPRPQQRAIRRGCPKEDFSADAGGYTTGIALDGENAALGVVGKLLSALVESMTGMAVLREVYTYISIQRN